MLVSEFKAKCISALKEVQRTREPMLISLRGRPLAMIEPPPGPGKKKILGSLKGKMSIHCDLLKEDTSGDWESGR